MFEYEGWKGAWKLSFKEILDIHKRPTETGDQRIDILKEPEEEH